MTTLSQLWGIAWYEMRLQWRRRSLLVVLLSFTLLTGASTLLQRRSMVENGLFTLPLDVATISVVVGLAPIGMLVMMLTLPPIVAETFPKDRQFGVDELLRAAPISPGQYLLGKILGVWTSLIMLLIGIAALQWLMGRLALGPIDLGVYLDVWLQGILPLTLFVSAMAMLLASRQPTRRRATMVGGVFTMYCIVTIPVISNVYTWPRAFVPNAWIQVIFYFMFNHLGQEFARLQAGDVLPAVPQSFVWQTIAAAMLQVLVLGLVVYGWWRVQER